MLANGKISLPSQSRVCTVNDHMRIEPDTWAHSATCSPITQYGPISHSAPILCLRMNHRRRSESFRSKIVFNLPPPHHAPRITHSRNINVTCRLTHHLPIHRAYPFRLPNQFTRILVSCDYQITSTSPMRLHPVAPHACIFGPTYKVSRFAPQDFRLFFNIEEFPPPCAIASSCSTARALIGWPGTMSLKVRLIYGHRILIASM